jgi:hypothetical protein
MASKGEIAQVQYRVNECCRIIAHGGGRRSCLQFAADQGWNVSDRTVDSYLKTAREKLQKDWDIDRPQMVADLLSQLETLQTEARARNQLNVALGCVNTAAKLAQLVSGG